MDNNKTSSTHRVTAIAAAYLDALGCKPIETEVPVQNGWIADLASYWYPTMTEAKKLHIDRRARQLFDENPHEFVRNVWLRVYGEGPFTVLAEVKISRADFKKDERKWRPGEWPANICFLAYPAGLIDDDELPDGWYGLETSKEGRRLRKVHRTGRPHPQHVGLMIDFIAAVGIRRDHRTRYAATRAWMKSYRVEDREERVQYSAAHLLHGLAAWLRGEGDNPERTLIEMLSKFGIKKVPTYCTELIAFFESLRKDP